MCSCLMKNNYKNVIGLVIAVSPLDGINLKILKYGEDY